MITIALFLAIIYCTLCQFSLQQYAQAELEAPDVIFQTRAQNDFTQYTPNIQKMIFITPWNKEGQILTMKYASKFDYVVPCWYDLSFKKQHILVENDKNFNLTFIKQLKKKNPMLKVLPRVYIANNEQALLDYIGSVQSNLKQAVHLVVSLINNQYIDGLVWDTPFNTFLKHDRSMALNNLILQLANSIKLNLRKDKIMFYNMANPQNLPVLTQMFNVLKVDGILIQNYDNADYQGMLNKSIQWVSSLKFSKIFMLLPFFSRRLHVGISTKQVQKALENEGVAISKLLPSGICKFVESKTLAPSQVPCYSYFKKSFEKIQAKKLGVGFWEGGNGLQNYYLFL